MKNLKSLILFAFLVTAVNANATKYVEIRTGYFTMRLIYLPKPTSLKKWNYDSKNDVYYRGKTLLGSHFRIHIADDSCASKFIQIGAASWFGGIKLRHVPQPAGAKKYRHDNGTDVSYYIDHSFPGFCGYALRPMMYKE